MGSQLKKSISLIPWHILGYDSHNRGCATLSKWDHLSTPLVSQLLAVGSL